jgi:acetyltransferase-like isoleucine patch superfamily enzyme
MRRVLRKLRDERAARGLAARAARDLTPPPPEAYASFGPGSVVAPPSRVNGAEFVHIGRDVIIHEHAWISVVAAVEGITPQLRIGDGTHIDRLIHLACVGEVEIGPMGLIGERLLITDMYHDYEDVTRPIIEQPSARPRAVKIGGGVLINPGVSILPGVTIGKNSVIGAGAVVTRDVPAFAVAVGNPARVVRQYNREAGRWEPAQPQAAGRSVAG